MESDLTYALPMYLVLVVFSIFISALDVKKHRISNLSLLIGGLIFSLMALVKGEPIYWSSALISLAIAPIASTAKIGAGDIKLISLLSLFFLQPTASTLMQFAMAFTIIAFVLVAFSICKERTLRKSIALAPAICGAVIWCAR